MYPSLIDKWAASTVVMPQISSMVIKSEFEFNKFEAVIWRLFIFSEKTFWSGLSTTLPEVTLADLITSSTLGIIRLSNAAKTVLSTLVSTVATTLSVSDRTLFFLLCSHIILRAIYKNRVARVNKIKTFIFFSFSHMHWLCLYCRSLL